MDTKRYFVGFLSLATKAEIDLSGGTVYSLATGRPVATVISKHKPAAKQLSVLAIRHIDNKVYSAIVRRRKNGGISRVTFRRALTKVVDIHRES